MVARAVQKTQVLEIEQIMDSVRGGQIRIPHFQRPFRWKREDSLRLFDSILKGYPLGNLLFWERPAPAEMVRIGQLELDAPAMEKAWWVIDGQQRITVIANCLTPDRQNPAFRLSLNLASGSVTPTGEDVVNEVPLWVVMSIPATFEWIQGHPEHLEKTEMINDVANRIRRFSIPVSIVDEDDETVLREIFDRLNNFGRRLTRSEVFEALHSSHQEGRLNAARVAEQIDAETNFGLIDDNTILKCILVLRGTEVSRDFHDEFKGLDDSDVEDAYKQAKAAVLKVVGFLQHDAGMPHWNLLPYQYLLVVLCRFFGKVDVPPERRKEIHSKLALWFWRSAISGPSGGSNTATERGLIKNVVPGDLEQSIRQFLAMNFEYQHLNTSSLRMNTSRAKLAVCAYWQNAPRSFSDGEVLEIEDFQVTPGDAATPSAFLRRALPGARLPRVFSSDLASWILDTRAESVNILTLEHDELADQVLLESHYLSPEWFRDNDLQDEVQVEELLRRRAERMEAEINSRLRRLSQTSTEGQTWVDPADLEL